MMIFSESKEGLQRQQGKKKVEQLEHRVARCPQDHGRGRDMFDVNPWNHHFICRTLRLSWSEGVNWVFWKPSHRIWQNSPENTGLDQPYSFSQKVPNVDILICNNVVQERCRESKRYFPYCDRWYEEWFLVLKWLNALSLRCMWRRLPCHSLDLLLGSLAAFYQHKMLLYCQCLAAFI